MSFASGRSSVNLIDITSRVTEADILSFYLGIKQIPIVIRSPLRKDKRPSFGLYSKDGKRIFFKDLSNGDNGGIYDLLGKLWCTNYQETLERVYKDVPLMNTTAKINNLNNNIITISNYQDNIKSNSDLQCKVREWKQHDIDYWKSYGITLSWLKYAEIYPISHKIIIKDNKKYILGADKYAYAYVEHKEGKVTLKIYQPFNKNGFKWANKHDSSVISLWTKVPKNGLMVCVCSSMKDALCLWANTGIPAIAVQGEGYLMSNTAINELKRRFKNIYVLFDNDKPGLEDGKKFSEYTGFTNIILPQFKDGKDISDLYKSLQDKQLFKQTILNLFKNE